MTGEKLKLDLSLSWEKALEICLVVLQDGNAEGKKEAKKQLRNMAKLADTYANLVESGENPEFISKNLLKEYLKKV